MKPVKVPKPAPGAYPVACLPMSRVAAAQPGKKKGTLKKGRSKPSVVRISGSHLTIQHHRGESQVRGGTGAALNRVFALKSLQELFGRDWYKIAAHIGTRTARAVMNMANTHFQKLQEQGKPLPAKVQETGDEYVVVANMWRKDRPAGKAAAAQASAAKRKAESEDEGEDDESNEGVLILLEVAEIASERSPKKPRLLRSQVPKSSTTAGAADKPTAMDTTDDEPSKAEKAEFSVSPTASKSSTCDFLSLRAAAMDLSVADCARQRQSESLSQRPRVSPLITRPHDWCRSVKASSGPRVSND